MKNSNKVKKIIIAIIAVIIIAAITVGILLATGVWDVNLSKKSKMSAGIEKLGESFTEPLKNLFEQNEENGNELKVLNNLVSGYFDFAEIQAIRHNPMYMEDYIKQLDTILSSTGEKLLIGAGSISHNQAIEKAKSEYKKYQVKTISPIEREYLNSLKEINSKIEKKN